MAGAAATLGPDTALVHDRTHEILADHPHFNGDVAAGSAMLGGIGEEFDQDQADAPGACGRKVDFGTADTKDKPTTEGQGLRGGTTDPFQIIRNVNDLGRGGEPSSEIDAALDRAKAYAAAGASGFFIPGLTDEGLIGRIVEGSPLPVNVMVTDGVPSNERLASIGVARISYGPIPYAEAMQTLQKVATGIHS